VEALLNKAIVDTAPQPPPAPEKAFDLAIDHTFGIVEVGEQSYYASELLFAIDQVAYGDLGARPCNSDAKVESVEKEEGQE
jgi:hypothetical protein